MNNKLGELLGNPIWTISSQVMGGIIMVGIYTIKNKINNKIYIGRSTIKKKWKN